jgi:hypothetical protein
MSAIWRHDNDGWSLLVPAGFPDEAALHRLVEEAPQLLPLSGSPDVVVLGREVALGSGYADLVAVEPDGRMVVIEVKLGRNAEARRAVVAQVLAYAAWLHGLDLQQLERGVLGAELRKRGHVTIADAVSASDQADAFDVASFEASLVGYLEAIGGELVIDLITVTAYDVEGSQVLVPQRIDPARPVAPERTAPVRERAVGYTTRSADDFLNTIDDGPADRRDDLRRICDWAIALERDGLATLATYHGKERLTLLPQLLDERVGLTTIWQDAGLSLWRSVFERRAPNSIERIEELIGKRIGSGNTTRDSRVSVLAALRDAYAEARDSTVT